MISSQKKIWLPQQDDILRRLFEDQGLRNWSQIAKKMSETLHISRKSAKQCRQRYQNHINMETAKTDWTIEEELMLIQFHNEIGNKWALIAQKIPGKSDNSVKNHFYSKLRKVLRKLNSIIHSYLRREFREININIIYKIVEACEEQFKEKPGCEETTSQACREVQNKMLHLSMLKEESYDSAERIEIYREVVREIYTVSKLYKRKSKKTRNHSIQAPTNKTKKKKESKRKHSYGYQSDSESPFEAEDELSPPVKMEERDEPIIPENLIAVTVTRPYEKTGVIIQEEEQGIKNLLNDAGLLQYQRHELPHMVQPPSQESGGLKISSKSSFKSYSEVNDSDHQFFDDSDIEKGFFSKGRKNSCFKNLAQYSQHSQGQPGQSQFYYH